MRHLARAITISLVSIGSATILAFTAVLPGYCDDTSFPDGIKAFKAGKYQNALDLFGAALPSQFQNPALHYYMANSYVHLKQREACIREYRIAYALEPDKEVGKLSKLALTTLGAGSFDIGPSESKKSAAKEEQVKLPPRDPDFEKALEALRRQTGDYTLTMDPRNPMRTGGPQTAVGQSEASIIKALLDTKEGTMVIPASARKELDRLRALKAGAPAAPPPRPIQYTDASSIPSLAPNFFRNFVPPTNRRDTLMQSSEIKVESAKNLKGLLNDKREGHRLVPQGTNLYVRNYKSSKDGDKKTSDSKATK